MADFMFIAWGNGGLTDVQFAFYDSSETIIGAYTGTGVQEGSAAHYSVYGVTPPSNARTIRWKSVSVASVYGSDIVFSPSDIQRLQGTAFSPTTAGKIPATMGSSDYSGNVVQTGDPYAYLVANLGALGAAATGLASAVWAVGTRVLTAGTNIALAKGTGLTGLNDIAAGTQMDLVSAPNATAITAIQAGLSKPGTAQTITPADTTAAQAAQSTIATNLDAKVSTRSTYSGTDTSGTTTLLARISAALTISSGKVAATLGSGDYTGNTPQTGDVFGALTALIASIVSGVWGAATRTLSAFGFTVSANAVSLPNPAPSGYGGGSGSSLTAAQVAAAILKTPANLLATDASGDVTVSGASQVILATPYVLGSGPSVIVPAPPGNAAECLVYGLLLDDDGSPAVGITVTFQLSATGPRQNAGVVNFAQITATTDSNGNLSQVVLRNDLLTPAGSKTRIICEAAGINALVSLSTPTFNIAALAT